MTSALVTCVSTNDVTLVIELQQQGVRCLTPAAGRDFDGQQCT